MQLTGSVAIQEPGRSRAESLAEAQNAAQREISRNGRGDVATAPSFLTGWARTPEEVREAQRLRFRIFVGEMGARLRLAPGAPAAHDIDRFDAFCAHLLVRARGTGQDGEVIATCRVLAPAGAGCAGTLYTAGEFDLDPVRDLLPRAIEIGRVCIDPAWRNGLVVMALWRELGEQMARLGLENMIGCSSVSLADGGALASRLWHDLKRTHQVPRPRRVRPWSALHLQEFDAEQPRATMPALIKGYLRCGGKLLGPPAVDDAFNTADFPMMLHLDDLPSRYSKRIFGA